MKKPWKVAVIGECMVELHRDGDHLVQTYGGDTFNTATYLSRAAGKDAQIEYMSAVGKGDSFSEGMTKFWENNGVSSRLTQRIEGKLPGLYAIEVDQNGERSFLYWRNEAAVKDCFETPEGEKLLADLASYDLVYLSGISLAVLKPKSREKLLNALERLSQQGLKIAFDFNFRPNLWKNQNEQPAEFYKRIARISHWLFLSPEELEAAGVKAADPENPNFIKALRELGAKEIIVKNGDKPCMHLDSSTGEIKKVELKNRLHPVDTTAAGDSFTAGYLASANYGLSPEEAIRRAQKLAAAVIMHPGAIIPAEATPNILDH